MSLLKRWLRFDRRRRPAQATTATVRAISARLERLPREKSRFLAGFAYILARAAHADMETSDAEGHAMREIVCELTELSQEEGELVVEIARAHARLLGGTENYVVTREFRRHSTRAERERLLACLYAVTAADGVISGAESAEITAIADELGFTRADLNVLRSKYQGRLSEFQKLRS